MATSIGLGDFSLRREFGAFELLCFRCRLRTGGVGPVPGLRSEWVWFGRKRRREGGCGPRARTYSPAQLDCPETEVSKTRSKHVGAGAACMAQLGSNAPSRCSLRTRSAFHMSHSGF